MQKNWRKDLGKLRKQAKDLGKLRKQAINSCNIKQFLTVPKLSEFGLIRKFRSRASISKKNQLYRSYRTRVMNKKSLNMNLNKFWNLKISKVDMTGSLDRWKQDEAIGAGFVGFGQTSKKLWLFEKIRAKLFYGRKNSYELGSNV